MVPGHTSDESPCPIGVFVNLSQAEHYHAVEKTYDLYDLISLHLLTTILMSGLKLN